jgi:DNA-binding IclR family transcriptional regulator
MRSTQHFDVRNTRPGPPAEAVDRALRLLLLLRQQGRLSVTHAAAELGVAPSTAHRLLNALCFRDFAVQDRDRQYRAGPQLSDSGSAPLSVAALRRLARPAIELLHDRTRETAHLMVLRGADIRFIDGVEAEQALRVGLRTGIRLPAYCTSGGRAMLAALPRADVDDLHRQGLPAWPGATVTDLAGLHRQLATVRKKGYAVNQEESEQGLVAVGACIRDDAGRPLAGVSVSVPSVRYRRVELPRYVQAVLDAAREAEARLHDLQIDH